MAPRVVSVVAVLFSAALGVGAGVALVLEPWKAHPAALPSAVASTAPPPSAIAPPTASAAASSTAIAATPPEDPLVCLRGMFAEGTFSNEASELEVVCREQDGVAVAKRVKEIVVKTGSGGVNAGMKEWAVLGFHELAAVAVLRGRCCPAASGFDMPASPGTCEPLADALADIGAVAREGVPDTELEAAASRFDKDARCIVKSEATGAFGGYKSIDGGQSTALLKLMHRAQSAIPAPKK